MKYLVMETYDSFAIVVDEEGRFLTVANLHYTVGQKVDDVFAMLPYEEEPIVQKSRFKIISRISTIAAAFILVFVAAMFYHANMVIGSLYISINPEVRLDIKRNDIVKNIVGVNDDGIALIKDYEFKGKKVGTVVKEIVQLSKEKGYLKKNRDIDIKVEGSKEWKDRIINEQRDNLEEILKKDLKTKRIEIKKDKFEVHIEIDDDDNDDDDDDDDDDDKKIKSNNGKSQIDNVKKNGNKNNQTNDNKRLPDNRIDDHDDRDDKDDRNDHDNLDDRNDRNDPDDKNDRGDLDDKNDKDDLDDKNDPDDTDDLDDKKYESNNNQNQSNKFKQSNDTTEDDFDDDMKDDGDDLNDDISSNVREVR